jgi:hypothetical protein
MKHNHNYPYPVDITDDVYAASILALQNTRETLNMTDIPHIYTEVTDVQGMIIQL